MGIAAATSTCHWDGRLGDNVGDGAPVYRFEDTLGHLPWPVNEAVEAAERLQSVTADRVTVWKYLIVPVRRCEDAELRTT
jgi:hypothetical protein